MPNPAHRRRHGLALLLGALVAALGSAGWLLLFKDRGAAVPEVAIASRPADESGLARPSASGSVEPAPGAGAELDLVPSSQVGGVRTALTGPKTSANHDGVLALSGKFVEYKNGTRSELQLSGHAWASLIVGGVEKRVKVPVDAGEFRLELYREGENLKSAEPEYDFGTDPGAITVRMKAPAQNALGTFVLFDPAANNATNKGEAFPFGTVDTVIAVRKAVLMEIEVVDRLTGAQLDQVEIHASAGVFQSLLDPTGQGLQHVAQRATSPVQIRPAGHLATCTKSELSVGAKGYSFAKITVNCTKPGRRRVELERAGSLRVKVTGTLPPEAQIRLRGHRGLASDRPMELGEMLYGNLAPGGYQVMVQVGDYFRSAQTLGSAKTSVKVGVETECLIEVAPAEPVARASVSGQIYLPESWAIPTPRFSAQLLSGSEAGWAGRHELDAAELTALPGKPGRYSFQVEGLELGTYALAIDEVNFATRFKLKAGGRTDVMLEVPPPAKIEVQIVDEATGEEHTGVKQITWIPRNFRNTAHHSRKVVQRDPKTGKFLFRVPTCEITIRIPSKEYSQDHQAFTPAPGMRVILEVTRRPTMWIELRNGSELIPWPTGTLPSITDGNGKGLFSFRGHGRNGFWFGTEHPGKFFLEVPTISGFQPHPPVEVHMKAGPRTSMVIRLDPE